MATVSSLRRSVGSRRKLVLLRELLLLHAGPQVPTESTGPVPFRGWRSRLQHFHSASVLRQLSRRFHGCGIVDAHLYAV